MIGKLLATEERTAIERWVFSHARTVPLLDGKTLAYILGKFPCVLDLADTSIAPRLALEGYWETWISQCIARRVQPGWACIDVGAGFGYYTLLLSELIGPEGFVEAWEPHPVLAECLMETLEINGCGRGRVEVFKRAAWSSTGTLLLEQPSGRVNDARIQTDDNRSIQYRYDVEGMRLDTKLDCKFDFVKIDASGETDIWRGMSGMLKEGFAPRAVLMKLTPGSHSSPGLFLQELRSSGYSTGLVNDRGDVDVFGAERDEEILEKESLSLWLDRV